LERLNKEIKRRTDVAGVSPTSEPAAAARRRCTGRSHDEWQVAGKRYLSEGSMALLDTTPDSRN
jgi:putative transposase